MFENCEALGDNRFLLGHLRDVILCLLFFLLRLMRLFIPSHVFFSIEKIILKIFRIISFLTLTNKNCYLISVIFIHIYITRVK